MAVTEKPVRPLTGWHVLAMFVAFFGVIIAVNAGLAWKAISTFPGLEVDNGYIASQSFDAERSAQQALNWTFVHGYDAGANELRLTFTDAEGRSVALATLNVLVGRTTESSDDLRPDFTLKDGVYAAPVTLAQGKWMMMVEARGMDGAPFRQRIDLFVSR
jgi:nitrogen fixation protein FixH